MMGKKKEKKIVIGITGASGSILAAKAIEKLISVGISVSVIASNPSRMVWDQEMDESYGEALEKWSDSGLVEYYGIRELTAPIASGSYPTMGMAIVPSSMATISALSHGLSDNLIRRAADVCLKEKRPLVVVPRESPLNAIHLENMTNLAKIGVTILPADPPYYLGIKTLDESADYTAERILLSLGITEELPLNMRYNGPSSTT
jgi:4-hydroxy-3-polyprenylbenzoate decarboxylase